MYEAMLRYHWGGHFADKYADLIQVQQDGSCPRRIALLIIDLLAPDRNRLPTSMWGKLWAFEAGSTDLHRIIAPLFTRYRDNTEFRETFWRTIWANAYRMGTSTDQPAFCEMVHKLLIPRFEVSGGER